MRCVGGLLPAGNITQIAITAIVAATMTSFTNAATVTGNEADPATANNRASQTTTLQTVVTHAPEWIAPTPPDGAHFTVTTGQPLAFSLSALDADALDTVHIAATGVPSGASLTSGEGNPASASFAWTRRPGRPATTSSPRPRRTASRRHPRRRLARSTSMSSRPIARPW